MKTRLFSILGVVIMLVAAAGVAPVQAAPKLPDYEPADGRDDETDAAGSG